ncbi:MAG: glycosyltransferase [Bacillota bacterium]
MSRLSQDYQVLYVDPPYPVSRSEYQAYEENKNVISGRVKNINGFLKVFSPLKIGNGETGSPRELYAENAELLLEQLQKTLVLLKFSRPLLWIYDLSAVSLIGQLDERGVVYDCVDSFASFSWADPATGEWENELLERADVVLTSARMLYETRSQRHNHVYLIPNAADYSHFSKCGSYTGVEPAEIKPIKRPRLAFVGAVYEWLDFDLLKDTAVNNPHWNLVIVGPKQHNVKLPEAGNLYWLGARDYKLLPLYIQSFDLMLIPFLLNEITKHANPIKLWEYLAAGKPVVSTRLPEVPELPEVIWLSEGFLDFQRNCRQVLTLLQNPLKRMEITQKGRLLAKYNSWEERCRRIRMIIQKHFNV